MRINHNIAALNTYRQLSSNTASTSKSLEKLSSGLRINRAGDDAAGLAISEKMRGQIRGLDQASRNSQDGISLIQTAEGALNETHSILQRMRELSVQAANDTNTASDRSEMQKEIDQLTKEITRISTDTEFNTKKLLDGTMAATATSGTPTVISAATVTGDVDSGVYTATVSVTDAVGAFTAGGTTGLADGDLTFDDSTLDADTYSLVVSAYDGVGNTATIQLLDSNSDQVGATMTLVDLTGDFTIGGVVVDGTAVAADGTATFSITSERSQSVAVTDSLGDAVTGLDLTIVEAATDGQTSAITVDASNAMKFQIGANADQSTSLAINDMSASALGVNTLDLSTQSGANSAIDAVDSALTSVSSERAKLGGAQNRLEHTINNLGTTSENLTASESRIRDVDMAKEMMEFTKNNILSQAAQAMLAQANQQPQGVLQLLQ